VAFTAKVLCQVALSVTDPFPFHLLAHASRALAGHPFNHIGGAPWVRRGGVGGKRVKASPAEAQQAIDRLAQGIETKATTDGNQAPIENSLLVRQPVLPVNPPPV